VTRYGYFLSSEEYSPAELVRQARLAGQAGFDALWISDHVHPWLDERGESGFVWSVIGAISQATRMVQRNLILPAAMLRPGAEHPPGRIAPADRCPTWLAPTGQPRLSRAYQRRQAGPRRR
jgi:Luciferase-like monooxygenase